MPRMPSGLLATIVIAMFIALQVGCQVAGPPADAGPAAGTLYLYPERIPLQDGTFAKAERGFMFVPVKRSDPKSATIGVEVYRFRALDPGAAKTPPIFLLHGGPSFQGLAGPLEQPGFYERTILPYLQVADLVVVGQRGIGSSKPTTIIEDPELFPLDAEVSEEDAAAALREACSRGKTFWQAQGLDLTGFTVIEAAEDVNDVRKALGYGTITLWGGSFGSHWAMAVMRYHPEIVARAVLRGMEGPDHTCDMPSYVLNALTRIAAAADQAPELKGLIPPGGLIEAFKTVIARAAEKPVRVDVSDPRSGGKQTVVFTARDVRDLALGYTGSVSSRRGMSTWPADVLALYSGDFSKAAAVAIRRRQSPVHATASFFMLDCASGISPQRAARLKTDPAVEVLGPLGWEYQVGCPVWQIDLGDEFRKNFETTIPTLIAQGTWDVSTPMENALELAPFFKNSRLVLINGGSHNSLQDGMDSSEDFRRAVMEFAAAGDMSRLPKEVNLPPVEWVVPGKER